MPTPGSSFTGDDQYDLAGVVIGQDPIFLGDSGVEGWDTETVRAHDEDYDLGDGSVAGFDAKGSLDILVPALIECDTEALARAQLDLLKATWRAKGWSDSQLHRRVGGVHEYVVGRPRGLVPVMTHVKSGVIPVMCMFRASDPTVLVSA